MVGLFFLVDERWAGHLTERTLAVLALEPELYADLVAACCCRGQFAGGDVVAVSELETLGVETYEHDERVACTVPYACGDRSAVHINAKVYLSERCLLLVQYVGADLGGGFTDTAFLHQRDGRAGMGGELHGQLARSHDEALVGLGKVVGGKAREEDIRVPQDARAEISSTDTTSPRHIVGVVDEATARIDRIPERELVPIE